MQEQDQTIINHIRPIYRGVEDIQKIRIQMGNRIAASFRRRVGMKIDASIEEDREKMKAILENILADLVEEYSRLTDSIVTGDADIAVGRLPTPKKFQPTPVISSYSELVLVDQYVRQLEAEQNCMKAMESALNENLLYTSYLKDIVGVGPKMAAVLISELDPYKAKYVTSYWRYAGLDTVVLGRYTNAKGETVVVPHMQILAYYADRPEEDMARPMYVDGCEVEFFTKGRDRTKACQVEHEYTTKDGEKAIRMGISFNPQLKTKLIGVLAPSFLKASVTMMNGEKSTKKTRLAKAREMGFARDLKEPTLSKAVDEFLKANGVAVYKQYSKFGEMYYNYRRRLESSRRKEHQGLSAIQIHNRALRYMVKEFLRELHIVTCHLYGLPIYESYEKAKLGLNHRRNQDLYDNFGIDTENLLKNEHGDTEPGSIYPAAVAEYIRRRGMPVPELETEEA